MKIIIKNIASRFLILFLVVQTFNLSINSLDFYTPIRTTNSVQGQQDYVDSMIEFLVENVMGFSKNTFRDKANVDNFSKQQQNIAHFDLQWFPKSVIITDLEAIQKRLTYIIPKKETLVNLYCKEVRPNPPQFLLV
ncbi:MAG: hypothetical protein P4L34_13710 [Paludibacter sp.]|nr:hypothetical protein [Paludibacter sp.]